VSEWREVALGEVLDIKHGYAFRGEHFGLGGCNRLVTPGNFYEGGGFRDRGALQKSYDGPLPGEYVLSPGALIVAMTEQSPGLLGSSGLVPHDGFQWLHNQRIGLVKPLHAEADERFIYSLFNDPSVRGQISATASGTKVRHTSPGRLKSVRVRMPSIGTQRHIAAILSAFDELIEINERRIEVLEDLARSLYREWFVRFRFPGHEEVEFVDSELGPIPERWEVQSVGEIAQLSYGRSLPATKRRPGPFAVVSSAGVVGEHDEALVEGPGIVLGRKGNVGSVWWLNEDFFPIDTTYYVTSDQPLGFLYWQLSDLQFDNSHAAVPGLSRDHANSLLVIRPDQASVCRFGEHHTRVFDAIAVLRTQSEALASTRDLLLPRLVTGRLDISEIDLGERLPPEPA